MPGSGLVMRSSAAASAVARAASRAASSSSIHGVGARGRKTTSVPAVRQPSHGCGSSSIAPRSARTTTGCCWRMRMSMRFIGSSKPRSSRNSEKSKPSSSLTGTNTASIGERVAVGVLGGEGDAAGRGRRVGVLEERAPGLGLRAQVAVGERVEERLPEHLLRRLAEQQLGRLGPLRHGPLPVGEHEVAADDLAQDVVEWIVCRPRLRPRRSSPHRVRRSRAFPAGRTPRTQGCSSRSPRGFVTPLPLLSADVRRSSTIRREGRLPRGSPARPIPRPGGPARS